MYDKQLYQGVIAILILSIIALILIGGTMHKLNDYEYEQYKQIPHKDSILNAYSQYRTNTTHLLDVAGISNDDPIMETDTGSDYLQSCYKLDSLLEH